MSDADSRDRGFELLDKVAAFGGGSMGRALGFGGVGAAAGAGIGAMSTGEAEDIVAQAFIGGLACAGFAGGSQGPMERAMKLLKKVKSPGKLKNKAQKLKHKQNVNLYDKGVDQYTKKGLLGAGALSAPALMAYGLYKAGPDALDLGRKALGMKEDGPEDGKSVS